VTCLPIDGGVPVVIEVPQCIIEQDNDPQYPPNGKQQRQEDIPKTVPQSIPIFEWYHRVVQFPGVEEYISGNPVSVPDNHGIHQEANDTQIYNVRISKFHFLFHHFAGELGS